MRNSKFLRSNNLSFLPRRQAQAHVFPDFCLPCLQDIHTLSHVPPPSFPHSSPPCKVRLRCFKQAQGISKRFFLVQQTGVNENVGGNSPLLKREFIETSKPQARRKRYSVKLFRWQLLFLKKRSPRPRLFRRCLEKTKRSSYIFSAFRQVKVHKNHLKSTSKIVTILVVLPGKGSSPAITSQPRGKKSSLAIQSCPSCPIQ